MDLETAVRERAVLQFTYGNHLRVVQPGALGYHVSTGNLLLRGYQVDGTSSSRTPPFWSLFIVDDIQDLTATGETFHGFPPGFHEGDKHLGDIVAELKDPAD